MVYVLIPFIQNIRLYESGVGFVLSEVNESVSNYLKIVMKIIFIIYILFVLIDEIHIIIQATI